MRVIAATNVDLRSQIETGSFRKDLFYRINVIAVQVPALRDRGDDVLLLADHFLNKLARKLQREEKELAPDARRALRDYDWPGNVRELRNVVERAVMIASGRTLTEADLPERLRKALADRPSDAPPADDERGEPGSFASEIRKHEIRLIEGALARTGGNQKEAARLLGMPLRTLVHKIPRVRAEEEGLIAAAAAPAIPRRPSPSRGVSSSCSPRSRRSRIRSTRRHRRSRRCRAEPARERSRR